MQATGQHLVFIILVVTVLFEIQHADGRVQLLGLALLRTDLCL